jgi:Rrf2 family protein
LLASHRGAKGGYELARAPEEVSMVEIVDATEGPVALTECSLEQESGGCEHEGLCPVGSNWQRINRAIREALAGISLAEMARPFPLGARVVTLKGPRDLDRASCSSEP